MNKLESLRAHLLTFPGKPKIEPDNLLTIADAGQVVSSASGTNEHFELRYKANVILSNFSGQADQLFFWVLQWLKTHQPDHARDAVQFEADILNDKSADVSITVDLSETVAVEQTAEGIVLHHQDEPSIEPELLPATEWTLTANDTEVETWVQGD